MSAKDSLELSEGLGVGTGDGIDDGSGMDVGPGVRTENGAGLAKGLVELEERWFGVEALQAELDEGTMGRQRGS